MLASVGPNGDPMATPMNLESKIAEDLLSQVTYIRYVDDCLVISKTLNDNEAIFEKLNSLHEKICFTREVEENNKRSKFVLIIQIGINCFFKPLLWLPIFV